MYIIAYKYKKYVVFMRILIGWTESDYLLMKWKLMIRPLF